MRPRSAFTLVELLVVVGIVAILVALLMPALTLARDAADRAKCLANLRSMAQAAHMHAHDHKGYMPVAGIQSPSQLGVFATPEGLNDPGMRRYEYLRYWGDSRQRPLLLPAALGRYMGLGSALPRHDDNPRLGDALATEAVRSRFACPAQDPEGVQPSYVLADSGTGVGPKVYMSYVFNAGVLARIVYPWGETPAGNLNRVRRPSEVFLFGDGNAMNHGAHFGFGVHAEYGPDETLHYYWARLGGRENGQFDPYRHRKRMNVVFVDGHGETLMLPDLRRGSNDPHNKGGLDRAGVSRGVFN